MRIWNGGDRFEALNGVRIRMLDANDNVIYTTDPATVGSTTSIVPFSIDPAVTCSKIMVTINDEIYLVLAEVEVFGEPVGQTNNIQTNGGQYSTITTLDNNNVALTGTATQSTIQDPDFPASIVIDGNTDRLYFSATAWEANPWVRNYHSYHFHS